MEEKKKMVTSFPSQLFWFFQVIFGLYNWTTETEAISEIFRETASFHRWGLWGIKKLYDLSKSDI